MKLTSMTDFVLEQRKKQDTDNIRRFWACEKYADFLKQPLELWMFVPCDEDGNILADPKDSTLQYKKRNDEYQQAKERCLFDGCVYDEEMDAVRKDIGLMIYSVKYESNDIIEDLVKYDLQLTETAIKQL